MNCITLLYLHFSNVTMHRGRKEGVRGERPHPALLSLALAARNPQLLLSAQALRQAYSELGFEIGERQLRNHVRWLLARGFVEIRVGASRQVVILERGRAFLAALGVKE